MKKTKLIAGILAAVMLLGLTGCGLTKKASAEDLVKNAAASIDPAKYQDMDVIMVTSATADDQESGMTLEMSIETSKDVVHIYDTTMTASALGLVFEIGLEAYSDETTKTQYANVSAFGMDSGWTKYSSEEASEDAEAAAALLSASGLAESVLTVDAGTELTLADRKKGEDYVVTWIASKDKLADFVTGMDDTTNVDDLSDVNVTATFSADTQAIKSIAMSCEVTSESVGTMDIEIVFKTTNGDKALAVPQDVIDSAEEAEAEDDSDWDFELSDDSDDWDFSWDDDDYDDDWDSSWDNDFPVIDEGYDYDASATGISKYGEGSDETIERLADTLCELDANGRADIWYFSGLNELDWTPSLMDGWTANLYIYHIGEDYGSTPAEMYASQCEFIESWYEDPELTMGDENSTQCLRLETSDGSSELDYATYDGDFFVSAEIYGDTDDIDTAMSILNVMIYTIGLEWIEY